MIDMDTNPTAARSTDTVARLTADFIGLGDKLIAYTRVRADLDLIVIVRRLSVGRMTVGVVDLAEPGVIRGDELVVAGRPATRADVNHALNTVANRELRRLDEEAGR